MMLTGILLTLFTGGCWLYCLADAAMTPGVAYRGLPKWAWLGIIAATFILGAIMWLLVQSRCRRPWACAGPRTGRPRGHGAGPASGWPLP